MPLPLPERVGRYEIVDRLGAGGMGVVYLATDSLLRRTVAIKLLPTPDDDLRERFQREARSAAALRHNNVVTIYDIGEDAGKPFITMEFLDGESIAEMVRRRAPLSIDRRLQLMLELCAGLGYAHKNKIIHRDIKPGNLMVTAEGTLKILDFGLARLASDATNLGLTRVGSVLGTPHYMSPEQVEGKVADERSDIFSVGVVFYELLTYQKAYPGDTSHVVLHNIVHVQPTPIRDLLPSIDPELEAIVNQGLEKDPNKRFQSLASLAAELARVRAKLRAGTEFETAIASGSGPRTSSGKKTDSSGARDERQLASLDAIAKRREAQVEAQLLVASERLARGELLDVLEACENAVLLDPDNERAMQLMAQAQAGLDEQQLQQCLEQARACLSSGDLSRAEAFIEQSLKLRADSTEAQSLQQQIKEQRRERERAAERARSTQAAVERAQRNLDDNALEAAVRAAGEALAYDPANSQALRIRERATAAIDERQRESEMTAAREAAARSAEVDRKKAEVDRQRAEAAMPPAAPPPAATPEALRADEQTVQLSPQALAKAIAEANAMRTTPVPQPPPVPPAAPVAPPPAVQSVAQPVAQIPIDAVPRRPAIKPLWIGVAAGVLLIAAVMFRLATREETPLAAEAELAAPPTELASAPSFASAVETARQRYAASDIDGAVSVALSVPESAAERPQAMQLIETMRRDAAGRAAAERQSAEAAPVFDQALLQQGVAKVDEASKLTEPADTARAVATYDEAVTLFREASVAAWSADRLVAEAQKQSTDKQYAAAIDFALQALQRTPDHAGAIELLRSVKSAAAAATATAGRRARGAGLTDTNSTGFRDARAKEAAARDLSDPAATKDALRLYEAATAAYGSAAIDARPAEATTTATAKPVIPVPTPTPAERARPLLDRAEERLAAGDIAGATTALEDAEKLDPANARLATLKRRAEEKRPAPPPATPAPGEIERIVSTAARMRNDADAVNYLSSQQARFPTNPGLTAALNARKQSRDNRIADLLQRARNANDERALESLDLALALDPARADVRTERDRRARAVMQVETEKAARDVMKKFEAAYESRNVTQFLNIASFRPAADLTQEFQTYRSIRVDIDGISVTAPAEGSAIVLCNIRTVRETAGTRQTTTDDKPWQLRLANTGGVWKIVEAAPRR